MCGDILSSYPARRMIYNVAVALFAYIAPLLVISYSYIRILYVLHKRCDRRTFRFGKCSGNNFENSSSNHPLTSKTAMLGNERSGRASAQEEINTHNMKTMNRAKLKTLKVTVLIGKFKKKYYNLLYTIVLFHLNIFYSHLLYSLLDTILLYCLFLAHYGCSYEQRKFCSCHQR